MTPGRAKSPSARLPHDCRCLFPRTERSMIAALHFEVTHGLQEPGGFARLPSSAPRGSAGGSSALASCPSWGERRQGEGVESEKPGASHGDKTRLPRKEPRTDTRDTAQVARANSVQRIRQTQAGRQSRRHSCAQAIRGRVSGPTPRAGWLLCNLQVCRSAAEECRQALHRSLPQNKSDSRASLRAVQLGFGVCR